MFKYLWTCSYPPEVARPNSATNNFGLLSSSPYVRSSWLADQERFYVEIEARGWSPCKITWRFKFVADALQQQLEWVLSHPDSFERLKIEWLWFNKSRIDRFFWNTPKQNVRDPDNAFEDSWIANAEWLADDAQVIIDWVRKNVDGPVSVI
jgi:hypothetical protein